MRADLRLVVLPILGAGIVSFSSCGSGLPQAKPSAVSMQQTSHRKSWMLPEAKREDLLYMADSFCCLRVFSYPQGKPVGVVETAPTLRGECSDKVGNVWVTSFGFSEILKFAHGGTHPIATLREDRNTDPIGCSVDSVTGNLAVANTNGTLAVFQNAQGSPTFYSDPADGFEYCTYDSNGNLFADGVGAGVIDELPRGSSAITRIALNETFTPLSMQWDGENLAIIGERVKGSKRLLVLYRVHVSGTEGTVVGKAILRGNPDWWLWQYQFWVQGSTVVGPGPTLNDQTGFFNFWHYPNGGAPKKSIPVTEYPGIGAPGFYGTTVSVAP